MNSAFTKSAAPAIDYWMLCILPDFSLSSNLLGIFTRKCHIIWWKEIIASLILHIRGTDFKKANICLQDSSVHYNKSIKL